MKILVTGHAGFIGSFVAERLLDEGHEVVGIDVFNDYYDPALKHARVQRVQQHAKSVGGRFTSLTGDLADASFVDHSFQTHGFDRVIHLAAQAGVRYSLQNPRAYVHSNINGFVNILEACRHNKTAHLVYASTSSVYGGNRTMPYAEHHGVNHPLQFYAATKRANELMAHSYSHLYGLPTTGLRFFTVYGPWGRPDMAPFSFTKHVLEGLPIKVFNHGNHSRDFTFVTDIAEGVVRIAQQPAQPNPAWDPYQPEPCSSNAPFRVYNIGNSQPVKLLDFIQAIEQATGKKAVMEMLPLQPGDVPDTFAAMDRLEAAVDYCPKTSVQEGVDRFVHWYKNYYAL